MIGTGSFATLCPSWFNLRGLDRPCQALEPSCGVAKFMSEPALHPLAHHSRFVQLSGLLPTDPASQEHELLCRAIELGLTFDQLQGAELSCFELQGAELSCFELLARRLQMLEMKLRDKVPRSLLGASIKEDSHIHLGTGRTRGLFMISPELEEFAPGVLAKETAAAKERRKLRQERSGAPPAGGKKK